MRGRNIVGLTVFKGASNWTLASERGLDIALPKIRYAIYAMMWCGEKAKGPKSPRGQEAKGGKEGFCCHIHWFFLN